jgi:hypothetical protein
MTQKQYDYLKGQMSSPRKFADAIARVLRDSDARVRDALADLNKALGSAKGSAAAALTGDPVPIPVAGCCTVGTQKFDGVSQVYCEIGLGGSWQAGPCVREKPDKSQK